MPIFDYGCEECGNVQEVITTSISQVPVLKCGKCGNENLTKLMPNNFGFDLKGEGWAHDGYTYTYTKPRTGEANVYPVYGRKGVKEKLEAVRDSMK